MFDQSEQVWFDSIMHRELEVDDIDGHVTKEAYVGTWLCMSESQYRTEDPFR